MKGIFSPTSPTAIAAKRISSPIQSSKKSTAAGAGQAPKPIGLDKRTMSDGDRKFLHFARRMHQEGRISAKVKVIYVEGAKQARPAFNPDSLLTPAQAAGVLKISTKTLANWRCQGSGPRFSKIGSAVRYRHGDLVLFSTLRAGNSTAEVQASQATFGGQSNAR